ncbi:MAG TPA: Flp pilus assembly protein CpaB [Syntrophomonadaceae bacterium]|nr:Flp pilus assembly protein CpaB [Syntrophomonadaceae bacterium]
MRPKLMILFAVILALLAAGASYLYLQEAVEQADQTEKAEVVRAKKDIAADTIISREMVEEVELPVSSIHPQALSSLDEVVGKIARDPIIAGEQILASRIVTPGETKEGLVYSIPQGKRAFTVAVDEVAAVGWHLQPGDHVDVLGTVEMPDTNKVYSVVVVQNVPVLAVGKEVQVTREEGKEVIMEVKTVTLSVSLQEAQSLMLASEEGSVRFALRSPTDKGKQKIVPFELKNMLSAGS